MKYFTLVLLYTVCSPLVLADNPVLGDLVDIPNLSPDAQFCELGKPKKGRFSGIDRCKKGDLLFFDFDIKSKGGALLLRVCEYGSISQSQGLPGFGSYQTFSSCIYRGYEMPIRE